MDEQVTSVCKTCLFYISWIKKISRFFDADIAKTLMHALVISRLDFCNSLYAGLPKRSIQRLQKIMNYAARVICNIPRRRPITSVLQKLHWLPMERITFKVLTMTHRSVFQTGPEYLNELVTKYEPSRTLRSSDQHLLVAPKGQSKYGSRASMVIAPQLWNKLPFELRSIESFSCFKKQLKTHLFKSAFNC